MRDQRWHDLWRDYDGEGDAPDLYREAKRDGKLGKPPSRADLDALRYAAEHSGMRGADG